MNNLEDRVDPDSDNPLELSEEHKRIQDILQIKRRKKAQKLTVSTPKKRKNAAEEKMNQNKGHWASHENKKYHWFLEIHSQHFIHKHLRRMDKIFKTMALFVGTR